MNLPYKLKFICCLLLVIGSIGLADDAETKKDVEATKNNKDEQETNVVKATGTFEALETSELKAQTEQIKSLKVKKVIPYGTFVKKGQNVVWFDTEDMDEKLKDAENSFRLAELSFQDAKLVHEQFLEIQKLDKAKAERVYQQAKQDYDNYLKVDREREIATADYLLKGSEASLENAQEEFTQLEKMYKEDELTEESEEIVLKRAKRAVESALFRLEGAKIQSKRTIEQAIPRGQADQEDTLRRAELTHDKALRQLQTDRERKEIEFNKEKVKLEKQREELSELREDRKKMVVQADMDGFVYYGELTRGKVSAKASTLQAGATFTNEQVLLTIVKATPLQVRVDLAEKELQHVQVGTKATVSPVGFPDRKFEAEVESISFVPLAGNKFDCVLKVKLGKPDPMQAPIMPGMSCNVEFDTKE